MSGIGRVAFIGTGEFGVPLLARLPQQTDDLLVISQPDRRAGRGMRSRPSPVSAWARDAGVRVETPRRLRSDEARDMLERWAPDGLLLVAYGQLVPDDLLTAAPRPPLNVHPSLLPRHRGAAPVASTILAGDDEAGVTLMVMEPRLDAGPIVAQWRVPLDGRETTPQLEGRLAALAAERIPAELDRWAFGDLAPRAQDDEAATIIHPFTRDDGVIDWSRNAVELDRQVRALQPWPGAWTSCDGKRLHVRAAHPLPGFDDLPVGALLPGEPVRVACGEGALGLDVVQPEGRAPMDAAAWRNGLQRDHVLLGVELTAP